SGGLDGPQAALEGGPGEVDAEGRGRLHVGVEQLADLVRAGGGGRAVEAADRRERVHDRAVGAVRLSLVVRVGEGEKAAAVAVLDGRGQRAAQIGPEELRVQGLGDARGGQGLGQGTVRLARGQRLRVHLRVEI